MTEPEVSLGIAIHYIKSGEAVGNAFVSIDGAHVKTGGTVHFDINGFMRENGYIKCDKSDKWQGEYVNEKYASRIVISSRSGEGDVRIALTDGNILYVESKKFKSGIGGEYPAMREAIGQLMTGCPDTDRVIPVVAVPYSTKSKELAKRWSCSRRIRNAGIRFILVNDNGSVLFI